jgi:RHS repeat-associated protein
MPHLGSDPHRPNMHWDSRDQLRRTDLPGGATAFRVYDASGQRVRKVWEKPPGLTEERIYLGGFEIFRRHRGAIGANTATLERNTLHVMDDRQRIALVEMRTLDSDGVDLAPRQLIRYQLGNHLGSASLELDEHAQIITYEEYSPYGSSTYQAVRSQTETPKRYRFTGKERDDESGLAYHGARYYAPWLGRWTSCDPLGFKDTPDLYLYARCNPVSLVDPTGTDSCPENTCCIDPTQTSDTSDPRSYASFEEWKANAPSPLSEQGTKLTPRRSPMSPAASPMNPTQLRSQPALRTIPTPPFGFPRRQDRAGLPPTTQCFVFSTSIRSTTSRQRRCSKSRQPGRRVIWQQRALPRNAHPPFEIPHERATQEALTPAGEYMSRTLEQPRDWATMFEKYGGTDTFETYEAIARGAGKSSPAVSGVATFGKYAGPAGIVFGVGVAGYSIYEASPEERPRVAVQEATGMAGGVAGAEVGTAAGTGGAVGIAILPGLEGPPGWLVLVLGIGGGVVGGGVGSEAGRSAGGSLYDTVDQTTREVNASWTQGIYNLYGVPYF